ncbi:hypothetical protein CB0940_04776 [Cercospora beticola]|uniref:Uncharacterized protein n=1 Tax=Cercospora beticola TaxID=122368 RepID=A0A2G5HLE7_CERBT|nr:hypothetical protein CB0940_04776 [Cercospora beticola]PIA93350.1 hypothetical protein CB0940_04776 [Cercospora beticola]
MLFVDQGNSVPRLSSLHIDNCLVGILHGHLVDPRLNVLVRGKLKHFFNFCRRTDHAATQLDTLADESKSTVTEFVSIRIFQMLRSCWVQTYFISGNLSSGAPTWMNSPLVRRSCKYFDNGIDGEETVQTIRSSDRACFLFQSLSSSVAMYSSAPIFSTSSLLSALREIPTTFEAPMAFANRTPKCPRPPTPIMPT